MLARHAEDLYWIGRYVERAEDTARLLDVTYHALLESESAEPDSAWLGLLEVLHLSHPYLTRHQTVTAEAVAEFLVADASQSSSIASALARARENARSVREHLSAEVFEALNSAYLELRATDLRSELTAHPHELYRRLRVRCQSIAGAATETLARHDPWRFLLLGRLVERAEMTCRLLRVRAPSERASARFELQNGLLVLNAVSALEAYRRAHGAEIDTSRVLQFLILAPDFPRSVLFCLRGADALLAEIEGGQHAARARRAVGRVRAELEYEDAARLRAAGAEALLDTLQSGIGSAAELIDESYFASGPGPQRRFFEAG